MTNLLGIVNLANIVDLLPTSCYCVVRRVSIWILPEWYPSETRSISEILVGYETSYKRVQGCVSRQTQSLRICSGESVCAFVRLLGRDSWVLLEEWIFLCIFFFVFFSSLNSDVLYGSYYLCYPRPELICHHELVGVMADLFPFLFVGLEL